MLGSITHESLGGWVADCECSPDLPVGIDSKVIVESYRFHFRGVSWEMGWRVTFMQFVFLSQHGKRAFYRDAHFPNCSETQASNLFISARLRTSLHRLLVPGKTKSSSPKANIISLTLKADPQGGNHEETLSQHM